jgi:hypothetical protein
VDGWVAGEDKSEERMNAEWRKERKDVDDDEEEDDEMRRTSHVCVIKDCF